MIRITYSLVFILAVAACGGDGAARTDGMAQAPDTAIKPVERTPLTEADMVDLDMAHLAVEIPWTRNTVERAPEPAAPRSLIESAEVSSHEGFDRMLFTFSSDAPFPGYTVLFLEPGSAIRCGPPAEPGDTTEADVEYAPELAGNRFLVIRMRPARTTENGVTHVPIGTEMYESTRIHEAGITCSEGDVVHWVAGLEEGSDVRVLELRSPQRLVVDVR